MSNLFSLADQPPKEAPQPQSRVDGRNRYVIPDPETGKPAKWTRATNFAKVISEVDGLMRWGERMVLLGLSERPDLVARAASLTPDKRRALDGITRDAKTAAGAWSRANYGTTVHQMTERVDLGELDPAQVGPPWGAVLRAYVELMDQSGVRILPEYVEQSVVVKQYQVAGTFDRIVQMPNGQLWIADVKTGRDLSWSWGEIAIQLALYAHADAIWDWDRQRFIDMPEVNLQQGLVIHLPVDGGEAALYRLNIGYGWEAADLCEKVRGWRKFKGLAASVGSVPIMDEDPDLPREWVAKIEAATSVDALSKIWREASAVGVWTKALERLGHQRKEALNGAALRPGA